MKYKDRFEYKIERLRKGITLTEIAKYIKVSNSLLSKYENKDRNMKQESVENYKNYIDNN